MENKELTGYPTIDKPWLKYFSDEAINAELPDMNMYDYIYERNKHHLNAAAINYYGNKISFEEMFRNIRKTADAFAAMGVKAGDIVAICSITTPEVIYAVYALNLLGAAANMIDPRTNPERISYYLGISDTKYYILLDHFLDKIKPLLPYAEQSKIICISPADSLPALKKTAYYLKKGKPAKRGMSWSEFISSGSGTSHTVYDYDPKTPAVIVYTGGTTGIPKGAVFSNFTMNTAAYQTMHACVGDTEGKCILNIMPPFIAYGIVCGIHAALTWGLTNVIVPLLDVKKLGKLISKYKPFTMAGVPMHYESLINDSAMRDLDLSFFEMPICGGDGMIEQVEVKLNEFLAAHNCPAKIIKGYGMTELGSGVVICLQQINKIGSVGVPLCKTNVGIFEPGTENELTYGEEGEICVSTPTVMIGYLANEEETKNTLRTHKDGNIWVHTGDIGYIDTDGALFIKGRMKRMIIRPDGHNVWPGQIENVILTHEAVEACAVVGKNDKEHKSGKWPVAFVVLKESTKDHAAAMESVKRLCDEKFPPRDTAVLFIEAAEIPHTDAGKLDFRALEDLTEKYALPEI